MMSLDAVYVCYWSQRDPLCQSQSLPVVRALAERGWRLGLLTYEQPPWGLSGAAAASAREELRAEGIDWRPLRYHKRPALLSTLFDVAGGVGRCWALGRGGRVRLFHARASVPAAIAWMASRLTGSLFFDDADGPLSEEYADAGIWKTGSLPQRLTRWVEDRCLRSADAVAALSERRRVELEKLTGRHVVTLPCAVDTSHFAPDPSAREQLRRELGLDGHVLVYSGKTGGWYRTDEMLDFAAAAREALGPLSLLVLTNQDPRVFSDGAGRRGLPCVVRNATRADMPAYLSAGDAGLSFRADTPSQRACSPIKNGEYLACGLPVVTTPGAGDYSVLVERCRVGVVVERPTAEAYRAGAARLGELLADPMLRQRCREVAVREVGLHEVVVPRYLQVYERLLGAPGRGGA